VTRRSEEKEDDHIVHYSELCRKGEKRNNIGTEQVNIWKKIVEKTTEIAFN